ncbi:MAG TPA: hypothetical protein VLC28_05520 [Flavitalea sp.]|nr:hypothetical protein [Flavitalea sp.]
MKVHSIEAFVPSGADMSLSKQLFQDLGFTINWDQRDYTGFEKDGCKFILQNYNQKEFAENLMLSVQVSDVEEFRNFILDKKLVEKYGIRISEVTTQPYGKEVNLIDLAGVCWHFVQQ